MSCEERLHGTDQGVRKSRNPLDLFTRFLEIEIRVLADRQEETVSRGSEAVIEPQFRGFYKAFVKLVSPEFVVKRVAAVYATYFPGVPIDVQLQENNARSSSTLAFEKQHRIMGFAIVGFLKKPLQISGAKDVVIYFSTPIEEGQGYSELSIAWRWPASTPNFGTALQTPSGTMERWPSLRLGEPIRTF